MQPSADAYTSLTRQPLPAASFPTVLCSIIGKRSTHTSGVQVSTDPQEQFTFNSASVSACILYAIALETWVWFFSSTALLPVYPLCMVFLKNFGDQDVIQALLD